MEVLQENAKHDVGQETKAKRAEPTMPRAGGLEKINGKRVAIYVPAYNCQSSIVSVLKQIPQIDGAIVVMHDDASRDSSVALVKSEIAKASLPVETIILRSEKHLGAAQAQKAIYSILREIPTLEWVIVLQGDGRFEPALIERLVPLMSTGLDIAYGYTARHEAKRKTPITSYLVNRTRSWVESLVTGYSIKEWQPGFVMYRTAFLRRLNLDALLPTRLIDGYMLYVGGLLHAKVVPVPVYKRTAETPQDLARSPLFDSLGSMLKFRRTERAAIERGGTLIPHGTPNPSSVGLKVEA